MKLALPAALRTLARYALLAIAIVAILCATIKPHFVRHWALYVIDARAADRQHERLFLDPFPDRISCELEAHEVAIEGAQAHCRSSLHFEIGTKLDDELAIDFSRATTALCALPGAVQGKLARR